MSGIIGGAGSKSGVIGTTELDYEEGEWTPTSQIGTFGTYGYNYYRKIGGWCIIMASFSNKTSGLGTIGGLPFATNPAGSSYEGAQGSIMCNGINLPNGTGNLVPYIWNNALYIYATVDDAGWTQITSSHLTGDNDDFILSASFFCVKT